MEERISWGVRHVCKALFSLLQPQHHSGLLPFIPRMELADESGELLFLSTACLGATATAGKKTHNLLFSFAPLRPPHSLLLSVFCCGLGCFGVWVFFFCGVVFVWLGFFVLFWVVFGGFGFWFFLVCVYAWFLFLSNTQGVDLERIACDVGGASVRVHVCLECVCMRAYVCVKCICILCSWDD